MEDTKLLVMFDENRTFLLSYFHNPVNKNTYEMSLINLIRHRMRYIWSSINMVTLSLNIKGPEQVWVTADYNRCFELYISFGPKDALENCSKKNKIPTLYVFKTFSDRFDDYFCKITLQESNETKIISNDQEFQQFLSDWIKALQKKKETKRENMLKKALNHRSQSATQLNKTASDSKKVHFSSPQILHNDHK